MKRAYLRSMALGVVLALASPAYLAAQGEDIAQENPSATPAGFVATMIDELRAIDIAAEGDQEARDASLAAALSEKLAVRKMNRFVLAREHRKSADAADVEVYDEIFEDYISAVFTDQLDELLSRQLDVRDVITRRPGDYIVRSVLLDDDGDERAKIDWRVLEEGGEMKLVDVLAEGLSVNVERRAQFSAIVKNDGFPVLLDHMRDVIAG